MVRTWCVLQILTSKCASHHNANISTSKSAPNPSVFNTFDFEMCFALQRGALFQHLNLQKYSEPVGAFSLLTSKSASRHNGVQFFISHLPRWLRTHRFSDPTCRPSGATKHWKSTVFRDFRAPASLSSGSFSSLIFLLLVFSSPLLFHLAFPSVHIVGSLTSKLPPTNYIGLDLAFLTQHCHVMCIYDPGLPSPPPSPPHSPPCGLGWWYGSSGPPPCGLWWWYGSSGPPPVACGGGMLVCWYVGMYVCR